MALSREQFQQLRDKGLSVEQIVKFERGEKPAQVEPSMMDKLKGAGIAYVNFQKQRANDALGVLEGATLGIPRAVVEQTVGRGVGALTGDQELQDKLMNLPRGSQGGQIAGSFLGLGALSKGAKAIPALAGTNTMANMLRGSAVGATAANTPLLHPRTTLLATVDDALL